MQAGAFFMPARAPVTGRAWAVSSRSGGISPAFRIQPGVPPEIGLSHRRKADDSRLKKFPGMILVACTLTFGLSATAPAQTTRRTRDGGRAAVYPNGRRVSH